MEKEPSVCRRVPETQVKVLNFIADKEDRPFTTVIKKVINSSPLFAEFRKQYELSANDG